MSWTICLVICCLGVLLPWHATLKSTKGCFVLLKASGPEADYCSHLQIFLPQTIHLTLKSTKSAQMSTQQPCPKMHPCNCPGVVRIPSSKAGLVKKYRLGNVRFLMLDT